MVREVLIKRVTWRINRLYTGLEKHCGIVKWEVSYNTGTTHFILYIVVPPPFPLLAQQPNAGQGRFIAEVSRLRAMTYNGR
jgi:hypothetical protein